MSNINTVHNHQHTYDLRHLAQYRPVLLRALKTGALGVLLAVITSLAIQISYPRSMALPQTTVGGKSYGWKRQAHIAADVTALNGQTMQLLTGDETLMLKPGEMGITLDGQKTAGRVMDYGWVERLTPFSLFFERRQADTLDFTVDEPKAQAFAASLKKYDKAPQNAALRLEGTKVIADKGQRGYTYQPDHIVAALKDIKLTYSMTAGVTPEVTEPAISETSVLEAAAVLEKRLQKPMVIEAGGKSVTVDPATLAAWMTITPDPAQKKVVTGFDRAKVKATLATLASQVYVAPAPSSVRLTDGVEVSRTGGSVGQALNMDATADKVMGDITQERVTGVIQQVSAVTIANRGYTRSSKGLQALFNYWAQSNGGQWGITIRDMSGSISASYNGSRQFTSASIYKLYVAYIVYGKYNSGEWTTQTATPNGSTVGTCMEIMIVRSDNPCAEALGKMIGWGSNNGTLRAAGMGSTSITYGNQLTTANDAATYLVGLQSSSLIGGANRDDMLSKLRRNIYRSGIPAGSAGSVANKVGFIGSLNHDAAIVYHPKGTYVLTVFSSGSSMAKIRELSAQVSAVMNQ